MGSQDGRRRVVIEGVRPEIDAGEFPIKRVIGETVRVEADVFTDGHDHVNGVLRYRRADEADWHEAPLQALVNDRWWGEFTVERLGEYCYTIQAWVDHFDTWRHDLMKRVAANQDVTVDLLIGANLVEEAAGRARGAEAHRLIEWSAALRSETGQSLEERTALALEPELAALAGRFPNRELATTYERELRVVVDPTRARYSTWYEFFPRSTSPEPGRHGTFADVGRRLPYVASLGFDVLYLPPVHPIGRTFRKGRNNTPTAEPGDPGSPWGIGAEEGGHKDIHPDLGTLEDFDRLVARAREYGIDVAMDMAFQASPDHPWVNEHPSWFRHRPDGTIQYAENPPKKYQDIYPLNFESEDWRGLWDELTDTVLYWCEHGIRVFRVDNPHTKPFAFWQHLIGTVKQRHPDAIFLAEAFTRPKVMYRLAKLGFTQSYTYFAWRNTKWEIEQYFTELTQTEAREFFRPNLWPNTPDILTEYLQFGGRPAFITRLVLAATLGANYGIYGPAFELQEHVARPGAEEYIDNEKYEIRHWNLDRPDSLKDLIARVNFIRREHRCLQSNTSLRFHQVDTEQIIAYSKRTPDLEEIVLALVNLDPYYRQSGWVELPLDDWELPLHEPYQVHDLITGARYLWHGQRNYVELDPHGMPAHIFRLRRRTHTERDFDYFM